MKQYILIGKIISGKGEGAKFLKLPWVRTQIKEKLGFNPYPGTLNLKLNEESSTVKALLINMKSTKIIPTEGFSSGECFKAKIKDEECAIIIPKVENYPADIVEIIASENLREKFQFKDGDTVKVEVSI